VSSVGLMTGLLLLHVEVRHCAADDDRRDKRSDELSLPDPYLDPSWPDDLDEGLEGRYQGGRSDSVEDVPFDEELEMQRELRAVQPDTGRLEPQAAPGAGPLEPPAATPQAEPAPAGTPPSPSAPEMTDRPEPVDDEMERDPVEW
jgi:hypothetical protein